MKFSASQIWHLFFILLLGVAPDATVTASTPTAALHFNDNNKKSLRFNNNNNDSHNNEEEDSINFHSRHLGALWDAFWNSVAGTQQVINTILRQESCQPTPCPGGPTAAPTASSVTTTSAPSPAPSPASAPAPTAAAPTAAAPTLVPAGWVFGDAGATCTATCATSVGDCNQDRMRLVNSAGAAQYVAETILGLSCGSTIAGSGHGNPSMATDLTCYGDQMGSGTCDNGDSDHRNFCCCGTDSDCDLDR